MKALCIFTFLVCALSARAEDKHADRKLRDQYAHQFASEIKRDGWKLSVYAMKPGCGIFCLDHGDHDGLRIVMAGGSSLDADRFTAQELKPREQKIQALGFTEIDIVGLQTTESYKNGMVRIPVVASDK